MWAECNGSIGDCDSESLTLQSVESEVLEPVLGEDSIPTADLAESDGVEGGLVGSPKLEHPDAESLISYTVLEKLCNNTH